MRADIHHGQEHKRSVQGPDTEAQDLSPPNHHFPLATRGRSIHAISGCEQVQQRATYSITSSARATKVGGIAMPTARAVFRLMTSSNLVGCTIGRSPGFSPFNTR